MTEATSVSVALEKLETLLKETGGDLALATARLADEQSATTLAPFRDRLASLRWIDKPLYDAVLADEPSAPRFNDLLGDSPPWYLPDRLIAQGEGRYGWAGDAASAHDRAWQDRKPDAHRDWHNRLASYFEGRKVDLPSLDLIYHANVAQRADVVRLFEWAFDAADHDFDVPRLNALLETIQSRPPQRETDLWKLVASAETYFAGRTLFRRDYQLTTRFFPRTDAAESFLGTMESDQTWIWHMHASGGVGKTTFLRWLIARLLLPKPGRAICARIDLDDYELDMLVSRPLRAVADILRQVDRQRPSADLKDIVRNLDAAASEPGWNDSLIESIAVQLQQVMIDTPVVIVLDTLEDATRTQKDWLRHLVETIARLRVVMPRLTLVLSGRYVASGVIPAFADQTVVFELRRFDRLEANSYLLKIEGVTSSELRDAILNRVRADEPEISDDQRFNPFKLYLLAEIVRGDPEISTTRIGEIESVDLAYLIERVILRIKDQPLRWLIRYAVVARELNSQFLKGVLLPELKASLEGKSSFDKVGLYRGEEVWRTDPKAAAELDAEALLRELHHYATDRGWISTNTAGSIVRLHPEVVDPTRKLLADQMVYHRLHGRAMKLAQRLAAEADTPLAWASAKSMEIFHQYQLDTSKGIAAWRASIELAREKGGLAIEAIAKEVLGKDYQDSEPACRARAHLLIASAMVERAIGEAIENADLRTQIVTHIKAAAGEHSDSVDPSWRELAIRMSRSDGGHPVVALPIDAESWPISLVYNNLALAWRLSLSVDRAQRRTAAGFVAELRRMRAGEMLLVLGDADLALFQSSIRRGIADAQGAKDAVGSIRFDGKSRKEKEFSIVLAKAANALLDRDLGEAQAQLSASSALAKVIQIDLVQNGWSTLLRMDYAIAALDPTAAIEAGTSGLSGDLLSSDKIGTLCRLAFAHTMANEFDRAEDLFREVEVLIEGTDNAASSGSLWERLKWRMFAVLRWTKHPNLAARLLDGGIGRGRLPVEHEAQIALFRVWIELLRGDEPGAGARLPSPEILTQADPTTAWALALATLGFADPSRNAELIAILDGPIPAPGGVYLAVECLADRSKSIPAGIFNADRLIGRLPRIGRFGPAAEVEKLLQADLIRVLGRSDLARKSVDKAFDSFLSEANLLMATQYEACRRRQGYVSDLDRVYRYADRKGRLKEKARGLTAGVAVLSAEELASEGKWDKARTRALEARHHFWEQREASGWSQRIWEIAALCDRMTQVPDENSHLAGAREQQSGVGLSSLADFSASETMFEEPTVSGWVHRKLTATLAQEHFDVEAPAWDRSAISGWVREWLHDPDVMRQRLTDMAWFPPVATGARVHIDVERVLAGTVTCALPWELASAFEGASMIRRTIGPPSRRRPTSSDRDTAGAILLIARPSEGNFSFSSSQSGVNVVKHSYRRAAPDAPYFEIDPIRTDVFSELTHVPAEGIKIVHLVASIQEAKGGYALDFRGAADYASGTYSSQFTARHLHSLIGSLRSRPLVILDIETPENEAAAAEMLLQRNALSQEVYDPGLMRGLIATGLAPHDQSEPAEQLFIDALCNGETIADAYAAIRAAPMATRGRPGDLYWSRASVLWCEDPNEAVRLRR